MTTVGVPTRIVPRTGVLGVLGSTDHKVIGLRVAATAGVFFLAGGILALLMRSELAAPGLQVTSRTGYSELFTMHGSTMVYLVMVPVALAFCVYFVPLQLGAAGIARARVALSGSWLVPLGGLVMWAGWLTREGPGRAGWYSYDPLSDTTNTPGDGMDLWLLGVVLATVGTFLLATCVLGTVLRRRAPGMTLLRMPFFSWTALATSLLVVFSAPALVAAMGLTLLDRHTSLRLDPIVYQHLFWFYGHPAVYIMFFPFVGMVTEAAAVFSGHRFFGYRLGVVALLAFTAISMMAWAHHMFTTGAVPNAFFGLTSTALLVTAGVEYFDIIATLWQGAVQLRVSMLYVLAFLLQFLIGGITGIIVAAPVLDYQFSDSYFVVAHFHYTLFAGSLFGLLAGLYLWWPKMFGRVLSERLGRIQFGLLVVGTNLTFFPQFLLGYDGMPRRIADYPASTGWQTDNVISTVGSGIVGVSVLLFVAMAVATFARTPDAPGDPWEGHSLEWWTSSPPPAHNFDRLPPIASYAPLYDLRHGREGEELDASPEDRARLRALGERT